MYLMRRINVTGGCGWGVSILWETFRLELYGVNFPLRQQTTFYFGNSANGRFECPRYVVYGEEIDRKTGRLTGVTAGAIERRSGVLLNVRRFTGPDMMPLFTAAKEIHRTGDIPEPLVDMFLDLRDYVPEIGLCENYVPTPAPSCTESGRSPTSS